MKIGVLTESSKRRGARLGLAAVLMAGTAVSATACSAESQPESAHSSIQDLNRHANKQAEERAQHEKRQYQRAKEEGSRPLRQLAAKYCKSLLSDYRQGEVKGEEESSTSIIKLSESNQHTSVSAHVSPGNAGNYTSKGCYAVSLHKTGKDTEESSGIQVVKRPTSAEFLGQDGVALDAHGDMGVKSWNGLNVQNWPKELTQVSVTRYDSGIDVVAANPKELRQISRAVETFQREAGPVFD